MELSVDKLPERLGLQSGGQKVLWPRLLQIFGGSAERRPDAAPLRTEEAWMKTPTRTTGFIKLTL